MKNTYSQLLLIAAVSVTLFSSCRGFRCVHGSGKMITDNRKVANFNKLDISGGYKVTLVQDSSLTVSIHADDNLLKYIKTDVEGNKLKIHSRKNVCGSDEVTITIGVRNLEEIGASGAVEVRSNTLIRTKDLSFGLSGATKIDMQLDAARVNTEGSGSTEIYLKGQAAEHNIDMSGSGKVEALDFVVGKYNIETSGASHCKINVLNSLSVHTSGASDIRYRGNPANVSNDKSGASSVEKID